MDPGTFDGDRFESLLRTIATINESADRVVVHVSTARDDRDKNFYMERERKAKQQFLHDISEMKVAFIASLSDFNKFEEVVKWSRDTRLHMLKGIIVCSSRYLTEYEASEVDRRCSELEIKVEKQPSLPRNNLDHWMAKKDD